MKKINIMFITLILMMSVTACSKTNKSDSDVSDISNDIEEHASEPVNKYEEYFGTWYGFGTDGESAQFEITIEPKDEFSVNVSINGLGENSCMEPENLVVIFSKNRETLGIIKAFENTENQQKREFIFDGFGNHQVLEIAFIDKTTGGQIAESIIAGRFSDRNVSFGSGQTENAQTGSNHSSEKDNFQKRYDALSSKSIGYAPQQETRIQSEKFYDEWSEWDDLLDEWDDLLNDVYKHLEATKSSSEFEGIESDQRMWEDKMDTEIREIRDEFRGRSGELCAREPFAADICAASFAIDCTKGRCNYLILLID